jgi:Putative prokaryotic signal transducing protein
MPEDEAYRLKSRYAAMTDEELQALADDATSLSEAAQLALQNEVTRRNLDVRLIFPEREVEFRPLVNLRRFRDPLEATMAKAILEGAGIECSLADENIVRMDWFWSNAIGGIRLQVSPEDLDAANEILDQPIPETFQVDGVGEYQQPHCPNCNSLDIVSDERWVGAAYVTANFSAPAPVHGAGWTCKSCGHRWDDPIPTPPETESTDAPQ